MPKLTVDEWLAHADNADMKYVENAGRCTGIDCKNCPFFNDTPFTGCVEGTDVNEKYNRPNFRVSAERIYNREKLRKKLELI